MPYKTITLELLEQRPTLCDRLRQERKLMTTLDSLAQELRSRHEDWKAKLAAKRNIDPAQIQSAAMEIAAQEMGDRLQAAFPADGQGQLSLDAAMAFIRNPTSHA